MAPPLLRLLPLLLILFIFACSGSDNPDEPKGVKEIIQSILKGDVSPEKGGITLAGPEEGSKVTLMVEGSSAITYLPKNLEKAFIAPGVKVQSYIHGVDYDTINASLEDSIDSVEIKYREFLLNAGYNLQGSVQRDGLLSTKWIKTEKKESLYLYAFEDGNRSRLFLVFTPPVTKPDE